MEIIAQFKELIGLVILLATTLGGYIKWKNGQQKSTTMLLEEFEKVQQKLILKMSADIDEAFLTAEMKRILLELKAHCPKCYYEVLKKMNLGDKYP